MSESNNKDSLQNYIIEYGLFGIVLSIFVNLLSNYLEKQFPEQWQAYYFWFLLIGTFLILLIGYRFLKRRKQNPIIPLSPTSTPEDRLQHIEGLKRRYTSRLKSKMTNQVRFEITLQLAYTIDGVYEKTAKYLLGKTDTFDDLFGKYEQTLKRLMIMGEPGSGKTVLLFKFANKLLNIAASNPNYPIPVILNLSSWRREEVDFKTWMIKNLPYAAGEKGISTEYAQELVNNHQILPLLDGFDEIPEKDRASCLNKLRSYIESIRNARPDTKTYPEYIISSRIKEFVNFQNSSIVFATVKIQDLTPENIQTALDPLIQQNDPPAETLVEALKENEGLRKELNTAFYVHTALDLVNNGLDMTHLPNKKALLYHYIEQELQKVQIYFQKDQQKYLAWIAWHLSHTKKAVTFELLDLQPELVMKKWLVRLVFGLVFGLVTGLVFGLVAGLVRGLVFGLIGGFIGGFIGRLEKITPNEVMTWHWHNFTLKKITYIITQGLAGGLIGGLIGGLGVFLVIRLSLGLFPKPNLLVAGLVLGIVFGLVIRLVLAFFQVGQVSQKFPKTNSAYHRINSPFVNEFLKRFIIISFIIVIMFRLNYVDYDLSITIPFVLLLVSLLTISRAKHSLLHLTLRLEKHLPLKLVTFLNTVTDQTGLLEKDGGEWRFRHQLIQDWLADWYAIHFPENVGVYRERMQKDK